MQQKAVAYQGLGGWVDHLNERRFTFWDPYFWHGFHKGFPGTLMFYKQ